MPASHDWRSTLKQLTVFLLFIAIASVGTRYLNSWLGQRALDQAGVTHLSMEQALAASAESGKPVIAKFAAIWCGACRQLDIHVFSDQRVKNLLENQLHYVRLEYTNDEHRQWFQRYGVNSFPRLMLLDQAGRVIRPLPVPRSADGFIAELSAIQ